MSTRGRPKIYKTEEEKRLAKNERNRKWRETNKNKIVRKSYSETINDMTLEEYVNFRRQKLELSKEYYQRKKAQSE